MSLFVRRGLQLSVFAFVVYSAFGGAWRNYKLAHNHRRIVALIEGDAWGSLYGWNEDVLSLFGEPFDVSLQSLGMPWASRVLGIDSVDPILAASHIVQTGSLSLELAVSLLIPLGLALLLGKVFCSHLCPMRLVFEIGQKVRAGLLRLGVPLPERRARPRFGGYVLLGGLVGAALSSTAIWLFILPYVSLSAAIFLLITAGSASALLGVVAFWFFIDILVAPGFWCHSLCPTGFLLEQVGRFSLLRIRKDDREPCPDSCSLCQQACPYDLTPKLESQRPACDNCGACVLACPTQKLSRGLGLKLENLEGVMTPLCLALLVAFSAISLSPATADAHHNKGLPHYGYFENYPQVPTEEYTAVQGRWEISGTFFNFQGMERSQSDTPNDVKIYLSLYDRRSHAGYTGPLRVEVRSKGEVIAGYERLRADEEAVYSTRETLPHSGDYTIVAFIGEEAIVLPFYIDVGSEGLPLTVIAAVAVPLIALGALAYLGRRRHRYRSRRQRPRPVQPSEKAAGAVPGSRSPTGSPANAGASNHPGRA